MNDKQAHTPTPWRVTVHADDEGLHLYENDGHGYGDEIRPTKALAELVQARLNAHDKLVAALRETDALLRECMVGPVCNSDRWSTPDYPDQRTGKQRIEQWHDNIRAVLAEVDKEQS
jgi:hypothetical protein